MSQWEDWAEQQAMSTKRDTIPAPPREAKSVQDKRTQERGKVIRVYREGWLLTEMEDGIWRLFRPDEIEVMKSGR